MEATTQNMGPLEMVIEHEKLMRILADTAYKLLLQHEGYVREGYFVNEVFNAVNSGSEGCRFDRRLIVDAIRIHLDSIGLVNYTTISNHVHVQAVIPDTRVIN